MSSATAQSWPENGSTFTRVRLAFRNWRRTRPFWGGLLAMLAGVPILYFPYAHLNLNGMTVQMATTAGAGSMVIGLLMIALGLTGWFQPAVRIFAGVATTILALVSIPIANFGGFLMGLVLGLVGGGLLVSWAPIEAEPPVIGAEFEGQQPDGYQAAQFQAAPEQAEPAAQTEALPEQRAAEAPAPQAAQPEQGEQR
ncbi:DUF6114 domain-containing protein [Kitasatospora sp. NPDC051853]|uniref:DUF6114 domain-containing protein n=1 Tax=Kitasatospora sp. NPDC051853 TaxID=3364058 RepID=UPI0037A9273C